MQSQKIKLCRWLQWRKKFNRPRKSSRFWTIQCQCDNHIWNSFKSHFGKEHIVSSRLQCLSWKEFCCTDLDLFSLRDSPLQKRRKTERRLKMRLQITSLRSSSIHPSVNNLSSVFCIILCKVEACKFFSPGGSTWGKSRRSEERGKIGRTAVSIDKEFCRAELKQKLSFY